MITHRELEIPRTQTKVAAVLYVAIVLAMTAIILEILPPVRFVEHASLIVRIGILTTLIVTLGMFKRSCIPHSEPPDEDQWLEVRDTAVQAVQAVQAGQEDPFRRLLDGLPCHIGSADAGGRHDFANQRMLDYCGLTRSEVKRLGWLSIVHPDEREMIANTWQQGVKSGQTMDFNHRLRRFDGVYRWFNARVEPSRDDRGHVVRWYGVITDIDDRQQAEADVRENERRLRMIVDTIPGLVWCANREGTVSYLSHRLLEYTGLSLEKMHAGGWSQVVHPEDVDAASRAWKYSLESGAPYSVTKRCRNASGGYRWHEERANALYDENKKILCWYGLLMDVDDNVRVEEALRLTRAKLARASQAAAIGELSASIAHEINQPLAAILSNGEACLRWLDADPPKWERAHRTVEHIVRDGNTAADIVRKLRSLFTSPAPQKKSLDLNDTITEALDAMYDDVRRKHVRIELDLHAALPRVLADKSQIQQALGNLITNTIEAVHDQSGRAKRIVITTRTDNTGHVITGVWDNGADIGDAQAIGRPCLPTKERSLGVGLSVSRAIIHAHDGELWTAANDTYGATALFTLPMVKNPVV